MNFFQKLSAVWQHVSLVQRALLTAIALAFILVGSLITYWARRPDMGVLYSSLDPEEAAKITDKVREKDVEYKLGSGGTTIYVPKRDIAQLRLDMAKEGLPEGGRKGYGIFDDEKIGISPFVQNINLKRALQEELAKSIQMIDGVGHARVHIVSAKQTLFTSADSQTTASIFLRLKPGYRLGALNVAAVTHLVAGSVEGLEPENITVVDSLGHLLTSKSDQIMDGGGGSIAGYQERVEQNLSTKVEELLTAVLGPGRAKVKVSALIDMNSVSTIIETPIKGIPRKEEIKEKKDTSASTTSADGKTTLPGSVKIDNVIVTDYQPGKTVKQEVILPGQIKSLTVAAFVDLFPDDPNETELIIQETEVAEIIRQAVGSKLGADGLKVVNVRFSRPSESLISEEESGGLDFVAIAGQASLGIMAICALLVLIMFSGAKKKVAAMAGSGQIADAEGGAVGLLPGNGDGAESLMLRKQITDSLRSNPEQAKQLFLNWLEEKES